MNYLLKIILLTLSSFSLNSMQRNSRIASENVPLLLSIGNLKIYAENWKNETGKKLKIKKSFFSDNLHILPGETIGNFDPANLYLNEKLDFEEREGKYLSSFIIKEKENYDSSILTINLMFEKNTKILVITAYRSDNSNNILIGKEVYSVEGDFSFSSPIDINLYLTIILNNIGKLTIRMGQEENFMPVSQSSLQVPTSTSHAIKTKKSKWKFWKK